MEEIEAPKFLRACWPLRVFEVPLEDSAFALPESKVSPLGSNSKALMLSVWPANVPVLLALDIPN